MSEHDRLLSRSLEEHTANDGNEFQVEQTLRPQHLDEYIGQNAVREKITLFIKAAKQRGDSLDHVLLAGPPGLGKTTLAQIIAREMGTNIHIVTGPTVEKKGDLAAVLTNLQPGDVLFIDEIHRLHMAIEEVLYGAMEDYKLDLIIGQGPSARTIRIDLPKFTLVGATTRTGLLSSPLRGRFGVEMRLDFYNNEDLSKIVTRSAKLLNVEIGEDGANEIACRARGTPRIANRLIRRVRDYAQVKFKAITGFSIDKKTAGEALNLFEIDERGLDSMDRKLLTAMIEKFDGGPVGIETLASVLSEERDTIEEVYEPFLVQEGFVQRTPRGRVVTNLALTHLGFPAKTLL
jgi:Holliday junction DNA helicase RuvB